ncbi:helix-turn-helix domain-containing protein [Planococcus faecalis]|uniref:helix-turn-helix domain-containing protein n=1 Tax=Planococcus faecalis TaxID=1598147 RepID=UPI0008D94FEB|nr:helix-turn-helix domain-containing protein [Planococcus faecalis]OHX51663.1 hypothetical protein BB777_15950 [Planococcus faecalis]
MNSYLLKLGSNMSDIRNSLSFTQEEFANLLGVSRPTIIKIEQDPTKMTKNIAMALFTGTEAIVEENKYKLSDIDPNNYANAESAVKLIAKIGSSAAILSTGTLIASFAAIPIMGLSSILLGASSFAALSGFINKKKKNSKVTKDTEGELVEKARKSIDLDKLNELWNAQTANKILNAAKDSIYKKEKECLLYFELEEWSSRIFLKKINDGEIDSPNI